MIFCHLTLSWLQSTCTHTHTNTQTGGILFYEGSLSIICEMHFNGEEKHWMKKMWQIEVELVQLPTRKDFTAHYVSQTKRMS